MSFCFPLFFVCKIQAFYAQSALMLIHTFGWLVSLYNLKLSVNQFSTAATNIAQAIVWCDSCISWFQSWRQCLSLGTWCAFLNVNNTRGKLLKQNHISHFKYKCIKYKLLKTWSLIKINGTKGGWELVLPESEVLAGDLQMISSQIPEKHKQTCGAESELLWSQPS